MASITSCTQREPDWVQFLKRAWFPVILVTAFLTLTSLFVNGDGRDPSNCGSATAEISRSVTSADTCFTNTITGQEHRMVQPPGNQKGQF